MKKILLALVACLSFSMTVFAAVNLNTASQAELESLKNVGPAKAQAIIDYRKKSGGFKTVEDLNNVPGFGDKTMANLKSEITVSGATKVATPTAKDLKPAAIDAKKAIKVATPVVVPAKTK
jgi:competence protein ComEA